MDACKKFAGYIDIYTQQGKEKREVCMWYIHIYIYMENALQIVPAACKNVEAQYVEMKVPLYSFGCEKKVKKALSHLKGKYIDIYLCH